MLEVVLLRCSSIGVVLVRRIEKMSGFVCVRDRGIRFDETDTTPSSVSTIHTVNAMHAIEKTVGTKKFEIRSAKRYAKE